MHGEIALESSREHSYLVGADQRTMQFERLGFTPVDVIEAASTSPATRALFTTYTLSPARFESAYLEELLRAGCEDVVVLTDPLGYRQSLAESGSPKRLGSWYRVRSVPRPGAFHAKLTIVECHGHTILGVGSGNLTHAGFTTNAEVGALVRVVDPGPRRELAELVSRLRAEARLGTPPGAENGARGAPIAVAEDVELVTSLREPILDQLRVPSEVEAIDVVTPFLDAKGTAVTELLKRWPSAKLTVHIDPAYGCLSKSILKLQDRGIRIQAPNGEHSPIHGKLAIWTRGDDSWIVLGSANFSAPALLNTENFEAVVMIRTSRKNGHPLLRVPGVRWRRARASDCCSRRSTTPEAPFARVLAECQGQLLSVTMPDGAPGLRRVCILRGTIVVHEERVSFRAAPGGLLGTATLPESVLELQPAPLTVRVDDGGSVGEGWLEWQEELSLTPELRRRRDSLMEIVRDPTACTEDQIVRFLEILGRDLALSRPRLAGAAPTPTGTDEDLGEEVNRSELIETGPRRQYGTSSPWQSWASRNLDHILSEIGHARPSRSEPSTREARETRKPAGTTEDAQKPELSKVTGALAALLDVFDRRLDVASGLRDVAYLIGRVPLYVKALALPSARFALMSSHVRACALRLAIACAAPGHESLAMRQGALARLPATERAGIGQLPYGKEGCLYLEAVLLVNCVADPDTKKSLIRDMIDVVRAASPSPSTDVCAAASTIWPWLSAPNTAPPDFASTYEGLLAEEGEVAGLQGARQALLMIPAAIETGEFEHVRALCREAAGPAGEARLYAMLEPFVRRRKSPPLFQIDLSNAACAKCFTSIRESEVQRLRDATYVVMHDCGSLLVRSLRPS